MNFSVFRLNRKYLEWVQFVRCNLIIRKRRFILSVSELDVI